MKKIMFISLIAISSTTRSQSRLKLDSVFAIIAVNNPSLKTYDYQIRSLDAAAKGARSWDAPQLSTGLWMAPYNPNRWKNQGNGTTGMGQYMISAEQMFPNKKRQDAEEKYLGAASSVEKEKKQSATNELYAAARQSYYQWLIAKKKLSIIEEDARLLDFMMRNAEIKYKNNTGKVSAYYKVQASLGNIKQMQVMYENEITQKRIVLNTLMNRDRSIVFDIDTTYIIKNYTALSSDSASLEAARSDIHAIQQNILLTGLQEAAEKSKLKPEFGIRYDHMFGFGGLPMQYTLMGMVKLPMANWSSRASKATVESLQWKAESLKQQKDAMINEATGNAYGLKQEILSKEKQVKLFEDNIIPALRKNFQTMQLAYQQNTEELFTLYDSWQTLNMTQLEYLDQVQQLLLMQVELERIMEIK